MNIKENSLKRALTEKHLSELPKQFREDNGEYWLEAIILTRKRDGSQSYVAGKRKADGKITYIADFGNMSPIAGLISIHPYLYLDKKKYMPYDTICQKRNALANYIGGDDDAKKAIDELPDSEVEYQVLKIAIETQYNNKDITATHNNIIAAVKGTPMCFHKENDTNTIVDSLGEIIAEEDKFKQISTKTNIKATRKRKNN